MFRTVLGITQSREKKLGPLVFSVPLPYGQEG